MESAGVRQHFPWSILYLRHLAMVGKFLDDTKGKVNLLYFYFLDLIHFICQMLAKFSGVESDRKDRI